MNNPLLTLTAFSTLVTSLTFAVDAATTNNDLSIVSRPTTAVEYAKTLREKPGYAFLLSDLESFRVAKYDAEGREFWSYDGIRPIDAWPLDDGSLLIAYLPSAHTKGKGGVRKIDAMKKTIFDYPFDDEIMSVQPLPNGNFLIVECHKGLITEMNDRGEKIRSFPVITKPCGHQTCRQIRLTNKGTLLAAECYSHKLREYSLEGKFLRETNLRFVYYPQPLPDDHVLCACWNHPEAQVVELDENRQAVWGFKESELPKEMCVTHIAGLLRLGTGNTLVSASCKANASNRGKACTMLFEITPDKKIVWQMIDPKGSTWMTVVRLLPQSHLPVVAG
jgi:hypothetical protein